MGPPIFPERFFRYIFLKFSAGLTTHRSMGSAYSGFGVYISTRYIYQSLLFSKISLIFGVYISNI